MKREDFEERKKLRSMIIREVEGELEENGFPCERISDLDKGDRAPAARLLVEMLRRNDMHPIARKHILWMLEDVPGVSRELLQHLVSLRSSIIEKNKESEELGWYIGEFLSRKAKKDIAGDLIAILSDSAYGTARAMLPHALVRFKECRHEVTRALLSSVEDRGIAPGVIDALGKMKAVESIPAIQRQLESSETTSLIKKEARKALKKLRKEAARNEPPGQSPLVPKEGVNHHAESSANFDAEYLLLFLARISKNLQGFEGKQIRRIEDHVFAAEVGDESIFDFEIIYKEEQTLLRIAIFMSDVDAPDVTFFSSPEVAQVIGAELGEMLREKII